MNRFLLLPVLGLMGGLGTPAFAAATAPEETPAALPSPTPSASVTKEIKVLGKKFGVNFSTGESLAKDGITASLTGTILGKQKNLFKANLQASDDKGTLQLFVNGVQVTSVENPLDADGWSKELKIPPVNASTTFFSYSYGPLVFKVDGGYTLGGEINTRLSSGLVNEDDAQSASLLKAKLDAEVQAAGYVEGSVNLAIVRGGLNGLVNAADGKVSASAELVIGEDPLKWGVDGQLSMFSGAVSAFADYWGLFGWKRIWKANLFSWKGLCYTFDNNVETNGKCAAN